MVHTALVGSPTALAGSRRGRFFTHHRTVGLLDLRTHRLTDGAPRPAQHFAVAYDHNDITTELLANKADVNPVGACP